MRNQLSHAFIQGREIGLETHQTELWKRYGKILSLVYAPNFQFATSIQTVKPCKKARKRRRKTLHYWGKKEIMHALEGGFEWNNFTWKKDIKKK